MNYLIFLQGEDEYWSSKKSKNAWKGRGVVGKTEVEVIRDWFINIFMPIEKTADIVVTDFKFEQLNHLRAHYQHHHSARNRSNRSADPGVESDGKGIFEK